MRGWRGVWFSPILQPISFEFRLGDRLVGVSSDYPQCYGLATVVRSLCLPTHLATARMFMRRELFYCGMVKAWATSAILRTSPHLIGKFL